MCKQPAGCSSKYDEEQQIAVGKILTLSVFTKCPITLGASPVIHFPLSCCIFSWIASIEGLLNKNKLLNLHGRVAYLIMCVPVVFLLVSDFWHPIICRLWTLHIWGFSSELNFNEQQKCSSSPLVSNGWRLLLESLFQTSQQEMRSWDQSTKAPRIGILIMRKGKANGVTV